MLTQVDIQNYRSIYKASVPLSPFTLLIGANGTGKSNFLKLLKEASDVSKATPNPEKSMKASKHHAFRAESQIISLKNDQQQIYQINNHATQDPFALDASIQVQLAGLQNEKVQNSEDLIELRDVKIFNLDPEKAGNTEYLISDPVIQEDGEGIVQVLDSLKTGDREDLFNKIEETFKRHIPEVEKLSFASVENGKTLQVRERHLPAPTPVKSLSEGMQLALMLITILYQERRPSLVCIEDLDRGLHPRLFQRIVELCFDLSRGENGIQIIATTHNPYLVDEFKDHEEAVVIVEKEHGQTKFTTLAKRLDGLDIDEDPLGSLWFSGFVGGVPQSVL